MNNTTDRLRSSNNGLKSAVHELKLEIAFHKSEIERLEQEKNTLHHDINHMSSLFKSLIEELKVHSFKGNQQDPKVFNLMAQNPAKPVSEMLQLQNNIVFLISCQPPYFLEVCEINFG